MEAREERKLPFPLGINQIVHIVPYGPSFLFINWIIELEPGKRAVGTYKVKEINCRGHYFDGQPVMPGVLLIEHMNQVGAVAILSSDEHRGKVITMSGADKIRFKNQEPLRPGDEIRGEVEVEKIKMGVAVCHGKVYLIRELEDELVGEGTAYGSILG